VPIVAKSESLNLLEPSGPVIGGVGIALPVRKVENTSPWNTQIDNCLRNVPAFSIGESVRSSYRLAYEYGTEKVFRNVGI
jgi:hypothetical protein